MTDPLETARQCRDYRAGWALYKESRSWPRVYGHVEENQVPAGQTAHVILTPENSNYASQWVDGRWVVNLFGLRDSIDLQAVTGEVIINGFEIPGPDQNITGQECNPGDDISFHFPDPAGCLSAASADDEACMAWWEVSDACQPPNGWGRIITNNRFHDDYVEIYRFRLNAPILNTTPAGTELDFVAEVRTNDLGEIGADNAVDAARWDPENFTASCSLTVLEQPGLDAAKDGPVNRMYGDTFTYTFEVKNLGNTPNDGWYLIEMLPIEKRNSCEFTPEYGKVYIDGKGIIVEFTEDESSGIPFPPPVWTSMTLQRSLRPGYRLETVKVVPKSAKYLRLRQDSSSSLHFNPGDTRLCAFDVTIPDDFTLLGKRLYNKAVIGASTTFGAPSTILPLETLNVRTTVSKEPAVEIEKAFSIDPSTPRAIWWTLRVHNTSGTTAEKIVVTDELPPEIYYKDIELPKGWELLEEPSGPGGQVLIGIEELMPDDGTAGSGDDEGVISILCILGDVPPGTVIENCAIAVPGTGVGGEDCVATSVPNLEVDKDMDAADRIADTSVIDVFPGDVIRYMITATNLFGHAVFINVYDNLSSYVDYVPGTFRVNGAAASDSYFSGGDLDYAYPDQLDPDETLLLDFNVRVKSSASHSRTIRNTAVIATC
ncbi:MAG: hypothetical protein KAR13_04895, partial [Desulfobulbaceae bacterium]|nr:hypothetical protein [Desulfobulbaceae bacterium]